MTNNSFCSNFIFPPLNYLKLYAHHHQINTTSLSQTQRMSDSTIHILSLFSPAILEPSLPIPFEIIEISRTPQLHFISELRGDVSRPGWSNIYTLFCCDCSSTIPGRRRF